MLYSIFAYDVPNSLPLREKVRPAHVKRLKELDKAGKLVLAGPNPAIDNMQPGDDGYTGSLIVAHFSSLEAAKLWTESDPYMEAGVYDRVEVKPFKQVLPVVNMEVTQQDR